MEIVLLENADAEVYSYRNKEECEQLVQYQLLGPGHLRQEVESLAVQSWRALGCRDAGRIDIRLDEYGQPQFIEVNPLAGIHPKHSDLPIMAAKKGVSYNVLIGRIMSSAMQRIGRVAKAESVAA